MADCTVADVLEDAMSLIGDPFGEISQEIIKDFGTAYSELVSALLRINAQEIQRETYFTVQPNTNVVFPSQLGVTDFAEPQQIWERSNVQTVGISKITDGTPIEITFSDTLPVSQSRVELNGIIGDASSTVPAWVNRDWFLTITGLHTATLNGSITMGNGDGTEILQTPYDSATGVGASAMWSPDTFCQMGNSDVVPPAPQIGQRLGNWRWEDNKIYIPGAMSPVQLWIEYLADSTPPASGVIGLCQGRERVFLAHSTAAHFAPKRGLPMGPQLASWAYGPRGEADGSGGFLRDLLGPIWKQSQQLKRRSGLYRRRRLNFSPIN